MGRREEELKCCLKTILRRRWTPREYDSPPYGLPLPPHSALKMKMDPARPGSIAPAGPRRLGRSGSWLFADEETVPCRQSAPGPLVAMHRRAVMHHASRWIARDGPHGRGGSTLFERRLPLLDRGPPCMAGAAPARSRPRAAGIARALRDTGGPNVRTGSGGRTGSRTRPAGMTARRPSSRPGSASRRSGRGPRPWPGTEVTPRPTKSADRRWSASMPLRTGPPRGRCRWRSTASCCPGHGRSRNRRARRRPCPETRYGRHGAHVRTTDRGEVTGEVTGEVSGEVTGEVGPGARVALPDRLTRAGPGNHGGRFEPVVAIGRGTGSRPRGPPSCGQARNDRHGPGHRGPSRDGPRRPPAPSSRTVFPRGLPAPSSRTVRVRPGAASQVRPSRPPVRLPRSVRTRTSADAARRTSAPVPSTTDRTSSPSGPGTSPDGAVKPCLSAIRVVRSGCRPEGRAGSPPRRRPSRQGRSIQGRSIQGRSGQGRSGPDQGGTRGPAAAPAPRGISRRASLRPAPRASPGCRTSRASGRGARCRSASRRRRARRA